MSIELYLEKMKDIQDKILVLLSSNNTSCDEYQNLVLLLNDQKIKNDKHELDSIMQIIDRISSNHHRYPEFFIKIEQILRLLQKDIKKNYSNRQLFNIFNKNKRILLFLLKENIIAIDEFIYDQMISNEFEIMNYYDYFHPEIMSYKKINSKLDDENEEEKDEEEDCIDLFEKKREIGENDNYICKLIREDSIQEFVCYMNLNNIQFSSNIEQSEFETNRLLMKNDVSLIEYAAFFGSIKIFQYLRTKVAEIDPSIWIYAIHSNNEKLIHLLESENIEYYNDSYEDLVYESIKCHNNQLVKYFINNYHDCLRDDSSITFSKVFKSYNFDLINKKLINKDAFRYLCKYGYCTLLKNLIDEGFDINKVFTVKIEDEYEYEYDEEEKTALHIAILENNINMIEILLSEKNIDINKPYKITTIGKYSGRIEKIIEKTPLIYAVENNDIELVNLLLSCPKIDVNLSDKEIGSNSYLFNDETIKATPLFYAVENDNIAIVKLLLANENIDVNLPKTRTKITKDEEETPLIQAIRNKNIEIVKLLLSCQNIDINKQSVDVTYDDYGGSCFLESTQIETPFYLSAFFYENNDIINLLISNENLDLNVKTVSMKTYYNNKFEKGRESSISIWEDPLIMTSIEYNKIQLFELFSSLPNFDINCQGIVHEKWKEGIVFESNTEVYQTLLSCAVEYNNVDFVKRLLTFKNIDVNALVYKQDGKLTALYLAAQKNYIEIIKLLLSCENIDVNIPYKSSNMVVTPLNIAIYNDEPEVVKLLLSFDKIDVNIPYEHDYTESPLYLCIDEETTDVLDLLLERDDIRINELTGKKKFIYSDEVQVLKTVLHLAVEKGDISIIKKLLSYKGIDANIKDSLGKKPIEYTNDEQIIQLINQFTLNSEVA